MAAGTAVASEAPVLDRTLISKAIPWGDQLVQSPDPDLDQAGSTTMFLPTVAVPEIGEEMVASNCSALEWKDRERAGLHSQWEAAACFQEAL